MERDTRVGRPVVSAVLTVVVTLSLAVAVVASWADYAFADSEEFARRSVAILDSRAARDEIAAEITDQLVQSTPEVESFRSILDGVVEDVMDTDAFRRVFHVAIRDAHHALLTRGGQELLVDLSDAVAVVSTTLQIINPTAAQRLNPDTANVVLDVSQRIQALRLWRIGTILRETAIVAWLVTIALVVGLVALERPRRRAVIRAGLAVVGAGVLVVGTTFVVPSLAERRFDDPVLASAVGGAAFRFLADLRTIGFWFVAYGVVIVTLGSAVAPRGEPISLRAVLRRAEAFGLGWKPATPTARLGRGLGLVAVALLLIWAREAVVPMAIALLGAYVGYLGLFQILQVVAPERPPARVGLAHREIERLAERTASRRRAIVVGAGALIVVALTVGLVATTVDARRHAVAAADIECNGASELCDRRIDQVAFPTSHNSMSAAQDPGWLFAENLTGIPDQLEYGIRGFLLKSHYGRPTGVTVAGAEIVVTDTQAEAATRPQASRDEIGDEAFRRAQQISASVPPPNVAHQAYLCHVYCELGATKFSDVLTAVKQFLQRNPNEVLIFVIGDFISTDDTDAVFQQTGLADRRWNYDPSQPLPTLRDLIDSNQNLVVMSEDSGQPPSWNIAAYGQLLQDTPFTFAKPDDFTCAANRGTASAPMFQINHWITTDRPPDVNVARQVNSYDVLMSRVRQCETERNKFPNIVGVNFYDQGDVLRVVDELNGVTVDRS
jgi:hypothetical protein